MLVSALKTNCPHTPRLLNPLLIFAVMAMAAIVYEGRMGQVTQRLIRKVAQSLICIVSMLVNVCPYASFRM